jgi:hypothetical protein
MRQFVVHLPATYNQPFHLCPRRQLKFPTFCFSRPTTTTTTTTTVTTNTTTIAHLHCPAVGILALLPAWVQVPKVVGLDPVVDHASKRTPRVEIN